MSNGRVQVDFSITLGNILTILAIIAGLLIGFARMDSRVEGISDEIATHSQKFTKLEEKVAKMDTLVREVRHDLRNFPPHRHVGAGRAVYSAPVQRPSANSSEE